jgi:hypothetical protein
VFPLFAFWWFLAPCCGTSAATTYFLESVMFAMLIIIKAPTITITTTPTWNLAA